MFEFSVTKSGLNLDALSLSTLVQLLFSSNQLFNFLKQRTILSRNANCHNVMNFHSTVYYYVIKMLVFSFQISVGDIQ